MGGISYIEELRKLRDEVAHFCDRLCQRIRLRRAILRASLVAAAFLCLSAPVARANVLISVDKASQQMSVSVDGVPRYRWTVRALKPPTPLQIDEFGYLSSNHVSYRLQRLEPVGGDLEHRQ